jgi:hypothetical protein
VPRYPPRSLRSKQSSRRSGSNAAAEIRHT